MFTIWRDGAHSIACPSSPGIIGGQNRDVMLGERHISSSLGKTRQRAGRFRIVRLRRRFTPACAIASRNGEG